MANSEKGQQVFLSDYKSQYKSFCHENLYSANILLGPMTGFIWIRSKSWGLRWIYFLCGKERGNKKKNIDWCYRKTCLILSKSLRQCSKAMSAPSTRRSSISTRTFERLKADSQRILWWSEHIGLPSLWKSLFPESKNEEMSQWGYRKKRQQGLEPDGRRQADDRRICVFKTVQKRYNWIQRLQAQNMADTCSRIYL